MLESIINTVKSRLNSVLRHDRGNIITENRAISYRYTLSSLFGVRIRGWFFNAWKMATTNITPRAGFLFVIGLLLSIASCWALTGMAQWGLIDGGFNDCSDGATPPSPWYRKPLGSDPNADGAGFCHGALAWRNSSSDYHLHGSTCQDVYVSGIFTVTASVGSSGGCWSRDIEWGFFPQGGNASTQAFSQISGSARASGSNCGFGSGTATYSVPGGTYALCLWSIPRAVSDDHAFTVMDYISITFDNPDGGIPHILPSSCIVNDPGFLSSYSWMPGASGATYSSGQWMLDPDTYIQQSAQFTQTGMYTVSIAARTAAGAATINFGMYSTSTVPIIVTSDYWRYYYQPITVSIATTYTVRLASDAGNTSNIIIDSVCFNPAMAPGLPTGFENCGLTQADLDTSLLQNSGLDSGWGYYDPVTSHDLWFPSNWNVFPRMFKRAPGYGFSTAAVGLPYPLGCFGLSCYNTIDQQLSSPASKFNLVAMVRRREDGAGIGIAYNDGSLFSPLVAHSSVATTTLNEWKPMASWFDLGESKRWKISLYGIGADEGYDVDEIYAIPGSSALTCGDSPPPPPVQPVPVSGCINENAHLFGPDSTYQMTYGSAVDGVGFPWVWDWHGRMGQLTPWQHVARLWPTTGYDSYVHQYVGAAYGDVSREYSGIVVGRRYDVFGSLAGYLQPGEMGPMQPSTATISVGNTSADVWTLDVTVNADQPSQTFWQVFTPTQGMLAAPCDSGQDGRCNISLQVNNRGGTSALIDLVCIRPISSTTPIEPPTDPPTDTNQCIGTWTASGGGAIGWTEAGDYIKNTGALNGNYHLWVSGVATGTGDLRAQYINTSTGITVALGIVMVDTGYNSVGTTWVTPPSGYTNGETRIIPSVGITIASVCLQADAVPPITPPNDVPIIVPIPECDSVNFYLRPPYTETTTIFTGTLYSDVNWAEYLSMQIYNYAVYPATCTTISIGNWQVQAFNTLMKWLNDHITQYPGGNPPADQCAWCGVGFWGILCQIICSLKSVLEELLDTLRMLLNLLQTLLGVVAALLGLLINVLGVILGLVLNLLSQIVSLLGQLTGLVQGNDTTSYTAITCGGDMEAFCMGAGIMLAVDQYGGEFISPIVYVGLAALSVLLVIYLVGRFRGIMQPGESPD